MFSMRKILFPVQNCEEITLMLCKELQLSVTEHTLVEALIEHPNYPSLLSISDIMSNLEVDNISMKTSFDNLTKLTYPQIIQIKDSQSLYNLFALIYSINEENVDWFNPEKHKRETMPIDYFLKIFGGYVQIFKKNNNSGERNFSVNRKKELYSLIINFLMIFSIPIVTLLITFFNILKLGINASLFGFVYTLLALAGSVISAMLLLYEVDQYNPVLKKVCTSGNKTNCAAILNSKGSKIFGFSWSLIGFSYFMGVLITLLIDGITDAESLSIVAFLSVLVLPYTLYSIYYQKWIVKQWCPLCLSIQVLLVLQFFIAILGNFFTQFDSISFSSVVPFFICLLVVFLSIYIIFQLMEKSKSKKQFQVELQRLKHNSHVFNALLSTSTKISHPTEGLGITINNTDAKIKLTKVCNPYCGPCSRAHIMIDKLIENNPDIQIQIIFSIHLNDEFLYKPVRHLLAISESNDNELMKMALNDWYTMEKKDYQLFAKKYPVNGILNKQDEKIEKMIDWCINEDIIETPTLYINDYQLPEIYSIVDIKYLLSI